MFVSEKIGLPPNREEPESESTDSDPSDRVVLLSRPGPPTRWSVLAVCWPGLTTCWPDLAACGTTLAISGRAKLLFAVSEPMSTLRKNPSLGVENYIN